MWHERSSLKVFQGAAADTCIPCLPPCQAGGWDGAAKPSVGIKRQNLVSGLGGKTWCRVTPPLDTGLWETKLTGTGQLMGTKLLVTLAYPSHQPLGRVSILRKQIDELCAELVKEFIVKGRIKSSRATVVPSNTSHAPA
jgi:hypothetical protein